MIQNTTAKRKTLWISSLILVVILFTAVFQIVSWIRRAPYLVDSSIRSHPPMITFHSKDGEFSMYYPIFLDPLDTPDGNHGDPDAVTVFTNAFEYNSITIYKHAADNQEEDALATWAREKDGKTTVVEELSFINYSSPTVEGWLREYSIKSTLFFHRFDNHCYDFIFYNGSLGYDFSLCVDQKYWPETKDVFIQMLDSITLDN